MINTLKRFASLWLLLLGMQAAMAQQQLQSPAQFLGYELGQQFSTQNRILDYVNYLAKQAPNRIKVEEYGRTYENRPLVLAYIASDENLSRLEQIRENNLRQASLLSGSVQGNQPAIVWLSYNVHGNESVSSEAVLQVMYDLVNPQNEQSRQWLQNTVVILDPMVNPDGRERYVQWYQQASNRGGNASPYAWEHWEPWPGGRPNHYYFDLNRDWAWQTQVESQYRLKVYNNWLPQVHADFHEMGAESPYYFSPAAKPFHESITPWQRQFQNTIGEYNRQYFDKNNWLYFTRESFDLFYPSYGDTWPTYNGAIGMTYEQGGSGRAGLAYKKSDGDTLTLADRIAHHVAASEATIKATSEKANELKQEFQKYYSNSLRNPEGEYKSFVIKSGGSTTGNLNMLTEYLKQQGIQYGYAGKKGSVKGYNYRNGKTERVELAPEDVVVSMYQPKSVLVKVLLEPKSTLEDSLTYDITSWALPYAYGVQAYAVKGKVDMTDKAPAAPAAAAINIERPYAYLASWNGVQDLKFATNLMQQNVKVRMAELPFEMDGKKYGAGTLIITRTGNERLGDKFDTNIRELANKYGVQLGATNTGFVSTGADFGSGSVRFLKMPKVAVLSGEGISPYGFGEIWHFFEQQINYPVTVLNTSYFNQVPLHEFDVLILPTGSYSKVLDEKTLDKVQDWVRGGGKLIALESAAGFLAGKKGFELKKKGADSDEKEGGKGKGNGTEKDPYESLRTYASREREALAEEVQGSVYRVQLDNTHPLAFGYGDNYFALIRSADTFGFMEKGWNVGVLKKDNYAAGYVGRGASENLQDALILGTQEMGRGQVVYLADNPLFRGFWQGGKLLFGNAVFVVGQ